MKTLKDLFLDELADMYDADNNEEALGEYSTEPTEKNYAGKQSAKLRRAA